jgi:hypothetical protein
LAELFCIAWILSEKHLKKIWHPANKSVILNQRLLSAAENSRPSTFLMASSDLYKKLPSRRESELSIEQTIAKLEEDIRRLKIEFDIYFNGGVKRPPLEARARLESQIKRLADNRKLTFAQRYQFNTLVSRYTAYRELWRRTFRSRGEDFT